MSKTRLGFLASYRGSNMQVILDACSRGELDAEAVLVISNNRDSGALARAASAGVPTLHLSSQTHPEPGLLDSAMVAALRDSAVDLVVLAGYMKKLGPGMLQAFRGRILNIHPSLLPRHGGRGMYGRYVHEAVIRAGERESGVTVHLVEDEYDSGPILAQRSVSVDPHDDADSLAGKILAVEHEIYVDTLARIINGEIRLPGVGKLSAR